MLGLVRGIRLEPRVIQAPVSNPVLPGRPPAGRNVARAEGLWGRKDSAGGSPLLPHWPALRPLHSSSLLERIANLLDPQSTGNHSLVSLH